MNFKKTVSLFKQMEVSKVLSTILENQAEQMKELKLLRKENQELRQRL